MLTSYPQVNIGVMFMRRWAVTVLIFLPFLGQSQAPPLVATNRGYSVSGFDTEPAVLSFFGGLEKAHYKSEKTLLHQIFKRTHTTFLKKYEPYSELSELLISGKYDCLTATAFFSFVLSKFHFQYSLIETNYHIFLVVHSIQGDVLLETTDRLDGFITDPSKIEERLGLYKLNLVAAASTDPKIYRYHHNFYHEISQAQLQGLLYFNQAVKAFNARNLELCGDLLTKAKGIYDSPRIEEMALILIRSVGASEADEAKKQQIIAPFREYFVTKSLAGL